MAQNLPEELRDKFELVRPLGSGASGAVLLVEDRSLGREVALKLLFKPRDERARARFMREAQGLAALEHESILRVYSFGMAGEVPYLVLEYLDGDSLHHPPTGLDAVGCMLQVAAGLEKVHAAGMIHRDVKPSNIMLTSSGRAVLVDFGLVFDPERTALTLSGVNPGTLAFQAPEVLRKSETGPEADWYAWGVSLYELLERRLPYQAADLLAIATGRPLPPLEFRAVAPDSPEARLVRTAMAEDPARRPRSRAQAEAILDGTAPGLEAPAPAEPPTPETEGLPSLLSRLTTGAFERPRREVAGLLRQRPFLGVAALGLLGLASLTGWWLAGPPAPPPPRPPGTGEVRDPGTPAGVTPAPAPAPADPVRELSGGAGDRPGLMMEDTVLGGELKDFILHETLGIRVGALGYLEGGLLYFAGFDDAVGILDPRSGLVRARFELHQDQVQAVDRSPDGQLVASGGWDKRVLVWDLATRRHVRELTGGDRSFYAVRFSPDSRLVAAGGDAHDVFVWNVDDGKLVARLEGHAERTSCIRFYPDGSRLAAGDLNGSLITWEVASGRKLLHIRTDGGTVSSVAITPDGARLITGHLDAKVRLWDARTGERRQVLENQAPHVLQLALTPDGDTLLTGSYEGTVRSFDVSRGTPRVAMELGGARLLGMDLSESGKVLATLGDDHKVRFFDHANGAALSEIELKIGEVAGESPTRTLAEETGRIAAMAAVPVGETLVVGLSNGRLLVRDLGSGALREGVLSGLGELTDLALSGSGRLLMVAGKDQAVRVRDLERRRDLAPLEGHKDWVTALTVGPKGRRLVTATWNGELRLWDLRGRRLVRQLATIPSPVLCARFAPEGTRLLVGTRAGEVLVVRGTQAPQRLAKLSGGVSALAFSPQGEVLAAGSTDGRIFVFDAPTGTLRQVVRAHAERVAALTFMEFPNRLASAGWDGAVRIWELGEKPVSRALLAHHGPVEALVSLPGGGLLSGGWDGKIFQWGR